MSTKGLFDSANSAAKLFKTFEEGRPELVPLGIDEVDNALGGLFKGTLTVVGMASGVGKSRLALGSALRFGEVHGKPGERAGIISTEDPEDVVGSRLLAWASGVSSLRIRRKDFTDDDLARLDSGMARLEELDAKGSAPRFAYRIGSDLDGVLDAVDELADEGCRVIWLDYLQKIRGVSDDRRNEVGQVMVSFQRRCNERGAVPVMLSQFSRRSDKGEPKLSDLKESGDIENEARLVLLGWESEVVTNNGKAITIKVAKSTFGGGGMRFYRRTEESGMLVPHDLWGDL